MKYECCKCPKISFMHAIDQLFFITYLEKQAITKEPENLWPSPHILE
jgi:hypothetical protein